MTNGKVVGIYIAQNQGDLTVKVDRIHVVPGMGIEGDRYFKKRTELEGQSKTGREITLIKLEAIESILLIDGIQITPQETRRNIITKGIPLNDLVGHIFFIGTIKLRGVRLCEPCQYLANKTDPRILNVMVHRGGLRADLLTEGYIQTNDIITAE
jgi:MOSC domain-containing protein YiiM